MKFVKSANLAMSLVSSFFGSGALTFAALPLTFAVAMHAKALAMRVVVKRTGRFENVEPRKVAEAKGLNEPEAALVRRGLAAMANSYEAAILLGPAITLAIATKANLTAVDSLVAAFIGGRIAYNYAYVYGDNFKKSIVRSVIWAGATVAVLGIYGVAWAAHRNN